MEELHASHYMHEFVKKSIEIAMDGDAKRMELCVELLDKAMRTEVVTPNQLILGIRRVEKGLPDLVLDVPKAATLLGTVRKALEAKGWLYEETKRQ